MMPGAGTINPCSMMITLHMTYGAQRGCQFSYLIGYWAMSAELYLQQSLVEDGSLAAPAGLLTSNGRRERGNNSSEKFPFFQMI